MCIRCFGFVLLIWFPGVLHAQSATQSCSAPRLDGGFFAPKQDTYTHETRLAYTCNEGRKPVVRGWWATIKCENGIWSHQPQCIDETACIPPTIPNANYIKNSKGWYEDGHTLRITCNKGYEHKDGVTTASCINGKWPSVPICEKDLFLCSEPPKLPHAIIINQGYQEVFAADTEAQYECEDGYTAEGAHTKKSIFCINGNWTEGPTCRSSTSSGSGPSFITIDNCGTYPTVPNGVVVQEDRMYLKYECNSFYTQVGLDTVVCQSDGTWSQAPVCKEILPSNFTKGMTAAWWITHH
ncbi:complement factor H-like [Toxotes jaculatrix]|uniref:complement factor H-like n=1 Tax=Toxotes jaculatrix TaxID=941984 RepID=UPI001B3AAF90|nr:complement factor H-like [Toxotes jaculatrix]